MTEESLPERRPALRVSHEERDRVAEQLRVAAGDGRLTLEELDERLERALGARTEADLAALVTDLPAPLAEAGPVPVAKAKDLVRIEVGSSSVSREGEWVVPRAMDVSVRSGTVKLDLTSAVISHGVLRITTEVKSGTLTIVTRPGIVVDADEVGVKSGSVKIRVPRAGREPVPETFLRVEIVGSVRSGSILARPPRRGFFKWLFRRPPKY
ncbi:DUF1707 SHOCT-like domain-containing protein [Actinomadura harenae]|uniref:DUF1707 domain-containing protein n=1 Tax=Actinomadura harenae TaxID=2483351 RepID=A0A3M2LX11_9ACTN|nr:DUF1707 domain-containing protein [Actinomadura harenae]RMI40565.1 DUF1707 domain-containing protein [Actinomadura harenae]